MALEFYLVHLAFLMGFACFKVPKVGEDFLQRQKSYQLWQDELLVALEKEWKYPLILKPAQGQRGRDSGDSL